MSRDPQRLGDFPGGQIAQADVANLAGAHAVIESVEGFFERRERVAAVNLVQVDVILLQPFQAGIHAFHDVRAREADLVVARTHAEQHLGGEHIGVAWQCEHAQCIAGDDLGASVGVEVRGVDEVDAAVERGLDEIGDVVLRNAGDRGPHAFAAAEGHGAEAHFRNDEARFAELAITHLHTPCEGARSMR